MKFFLLATWAALVICTGCVSKFDKQNVTGAEFAKSKTPLFQVDSQSVSLSMDTTGSVRAYTSLLPLSWRADGLCRLGNIQNFGLFGYVEFGAVQSAIPPDFFAFFDNGVYSPMDSLHGIDSIRFDLCFQTSSGFSNAAIPYKIAVYRGARKLRSSSGSVVSSLNDSLFTQWVPLDTLSDTLRPGDSLTAGVWLSDTSRPLFYYLDSMLLAHPSDTSVVPVTFRLIPDALHPGLLSLRTAPAPVITFFGRYVPEYHGWRNDTLVSWNGPLKTDSVKTHVRTVGYAAPLQAADSIVFHKYPSVSTVCVQPGANDPLRRIDTVNRDSILAGYPQAIFILNRDSLFRNLTRDSMSILGARAVFYIIRDSSFVEDGQGVDLTVECLLVNSSGQALQVSGAIYQNRDTTFTGVSARTDSLVLPIDKFMAALTNPNYADITTLSFRIRPYHITINQTSLNRAARIVFERRVKVDFRYARFFSDLN